MLAEHTRKEVPTRVSGDWKVGHLLLLTLFVLLDNKGLEQEKGGVRAQPSFKGEGGLLIFLHGNFGAA